MMNVPWRMMRWLLAELAGIDFLSVKREESALSGAQKWLKTWTTWRRIRGVIRGGNYQVNCFWTE